VDVCKAHTGAGWVGQSYECYTQGFRESGNESDDFGIKNDYCKNITDNENGNSNDFSNKKERETKLNDVRSEESHDKYNAGDQTHTSSKIKDVLDYNIKDNNNNDNCNGRLSNNEYKDRSYTNSINDYSKFSKNVGYDYANKKMFNNDENVKNNQDSAESKYKTYVEEQKNKMNNRCNDSNKTALSNSKIANNVFDISTENFFIFTVFEPTWIYLSLIQKTKRGKNRSIAHRSYWYSSLAITVFEIENEILTGNDVFYDSYNNHNNDNDNDNGNDNNFNNNNNKRKYMRLGEYVACSCHGSVRDSPPLELQLPPGQPQPTPTPVTCHPSICHAIHTFIHSYIFATIIMLLSVNYLIPLFVEFILSFL
jgi:hypothetical protein